MLQRPRVHNKAMCGREKREKKYFAVAYQVIQFLSQAKGKVVWASIAT